LQEVPWKQADWDPIAVEQDSSIHNSLWRAARLEIDPNIKDDNPYYI